MAKLVFIAEHDEKLRETLKKNILEAGYTVLVAENGEEALKDLNVNHVPVAIITATTLPEKSGLEVCQGIRSDHRLSKAPIIVIKDKDTNEAAFRELGVEEFVSKPIPFSELSVTLAILAKYGSRSKIPEKKKGPSQGMLALIVLFVALAFLTFIMLGMGKGKKDKEKTKKRSQVHLPVVETLV